MSCAPPPSQDTRIALPRGHCRRPVLNRSRSTIFAARALIAAASPPRCAGAVSLLRRLSSPFGGLGTATAASVGGGSGQGRAGQEVLEREWPCPLEPLERERPRSRNLRVSCFVSDTSKTYLLSRTLLLLFLL
jgi:hypothetical protein